MRAGFSRHNHKPQAYSGCKSPDRRKAISCRIEPSFSLSRPPFPQPFPELRKPRPSRRFRQQPRPMPVISLRSIMGIITDTTRAITIITAITITIIITTSDLALGGCATIALSLRRADLPVRQRNGTVNRSVSLSPVSHTVRSLNHAEPYAAGATGQSQQERPEA
jgi:hypothetical protein